MSMRAKKGPKPKPMPLTMARLRKNSQSIQRTFVSYPIDFTRQFSVLELLSCFYVEISFMEEDEVETTELYYIKEKRSVTGTLISRIREGNGHNEMRSYDRDTRLPLYCQVKLR